MGRAKEEWMHQQVLEPMYEWIEDNYGFVAGAIIYPPSIIPVK